MLLEMVFTALFVFVLMGAWILFQHFIRRHTPGASANPDPLSDQFGCSSCKLSDNCGIATSKPENPPVDIRLYD